MQRAGLVQLQAEEDEAFIDVVALIFCNERNRGLRASFGEIGVLRAGHRAIRIDQRAQNTRRYTG